MTELLTVVRLGVCRLRRSWVWEWSELLYEMRREGGWLGLGVYVCRFRLNLGECIMLRLWRVVCTLGVGVMVQWMHLSTMCWVATRLLG